MMQVNAQKLCLKVWEDCVTPGRKRQTSRDALGFRSGARAIRLSDALHAHEKRDEAVDVRVSELAHHHVERVHVQLHPSPKPTSVQAQPET